MVCAVQIGASAKIISAGEDLARITGKSLVGTDWYSWIPQRDIPERTQRTESVADGAILRTIRRVTLNQGTIYSFEVISLPMRPGRDGTVQISTFFDWNPADATAVLSSFYEITKPPISGHFIPIIRARPDCSSETSLKVLTVEQRAKLTSQAAVRLVLNFMRVAMKECATIELDSTDYLIAITVEAQNLAHIADDRHTSLRYAQIIEPAWIRRGISRAEVSRITHIAPETVRRRINHLIRKGILEERCDGIVVSTNPNGIASHSGKMRANAELVETLIEELRVRGIVY